MPFWYMELCLPCVTDNARSSLNVHPRFGKSLTNQGYPFLDLSGTGYVSGFVGNVLSDQGRNNRHRTADDHFQEPVGRIITVRTTHHECAVHLNGATAVEVTEAPISILINPDMAIVNSKIKPELSCNEGDCKSFALCSPEGVVEGETYVVTEVIGNSSDI